MLDTEISELVVVSEPSGRQFIGIMPNPIVNDDGMMILNQPMMFAEQKSIDQQSGGMQVQIMMMPILFTEFVADITLLPTSWITIPAHSKIAIQYRSQWDEYESTVRAQSAGIITARSMPKGSVVAAPNGRF